MEVRERTRNEASHGRADDMGLPAAERVQQSDRVGSHIRQRVRHRGQVAGERRGQVRRRGIGQVGGEPGVTIVEADDLQAAFDERMAEGVRPINRLRGDPHDEQHESRIGAPEALVGDVDPGWSHL
jgi:hypothetical protein